jgi:hypothetical protein
MGSLPKRFGGERTKVVDRASFLPYTTVTEKVKQALGLRKARYILRESESYDILKSMGWFKGELPREAKGKRGKKFLTGTKQGQ